MKKKLLTALCALTAAVITVSSAGCAKRNNDDGSAPVIVASGAAVLNLDDYSLDYTANIDGGKVERAPKIDSLRDTTAVYCGDGLILYRDSSSLYGIYNVKAGRIIASGLQNLPQPMETVGDISLYSVRKNLGTGNVYDCICVEDGTRLLTDCVSVNGAEIKKLKVSGSAELKEVLVISAEVLRNDERETNIRYFQVVRDEKTEKFSALAPLPESAISADKTYEEGGDYNSAFRNLVYGEKEVTGPIAKYTWERLGNTYLFYDGTGEATGSVKVVNGGVLGFVSNYMYYFTNAPVYAEASSGFNYITRDGDKYTYALNRYDIINNINTTLAFNAVITRFEPLYNKTKKVYDGVIIRGFGISNGIAYFGYNSFCHMADGELRSVYDLDKFGNTTAIYKLGETETANDKKWYYMGGFVVDDQLNVSTHAQANCVYPEQQLVAFEKDGLTGFADFEGKVVISPKYNTDGVTFYNDIAYVTRYDENGNELKILLDKTGKEVNLSLRESSSVAGNCTVTVYGGFYEVKTVGTRDTDLTYEYYSFGGAKLLTLISGASTSSVSCVDCGGAYVIVESNGSETNYYRVS